ncbi:MAG: hypothetical protein AB4372_12020 [Xenococcus sp. (in: cyanobacteria)]
MLDVDQLFFIAYYTSQKFKVELDSIKNFLEQLEQQGYHLTDGYAFPFSNPSNIIRDKSKIEEEISKISSLDSLGGTLYFWQYPFEFSFSLLFEPEKDTKWTIDVEINTLIGAKNDLGEQNSLKLIQVVKTALKNYPPVYGCAVTLQEPPLPEDIYALEVTELFPINFYGSNYVQHLGKERLLAAPAWSVEEIASGVLLLPSIESIYTDDPVGIRMVKEYLGWEDSIE